MSNWSAGNCQPVEAVTMETIVLCFPVTAEQVEQIQQAASTARVIVAEQSEIAEAIFAATVFCGHAKVPMPWEQVVEQGRLRWIQSTAAGLDHCLVPSVMRSNIVVSGSAGLFSRQVAEHTLALLLALLRGIPTFLAAQARRQYERLPTAEVQGARVGILGFGGNGQRIAEYLLPLRPHSIMATDYFADEIAMPGVAVVPPDRTDEVFANADILICTLPLLETTRLSIGRAQFARMPVGSWFINVGRGQLVNEEALVEALQSGQLRGAAIDVAFHEPPHDDSPLWSAPNLLITPHVGAQSRYRVSDTVRLFCDNLARWQQGLPLWNEVDKDLGFSRPSRRIPHDWPAR